MAENGKKNYLQGAAILTATVALTKVIGMIYKMPLYSILGDEGTTHFQITYTIYSLLLTISTAGIPVALSRLISSARATGRPTQIRRYYNVGMATFVAIGVVGMLVMYFFAQPLADFTGDFEIANGVRALAPAVLFACVISVYRGYSQGHEDMVPTAISQIMEVICKLVFGLAIAWWLSKRNAGSAAISAGAIVGVTIGLGLAIPILMYYKRRSDRKNTAVYDDIPASRLFTLKQIVKISVPITLGASIMNIITLVDTKLILERLQSGAGLSYEAAKILNGAYSKGLTLFNIPSAFITPVSVSVVPFIAAALAKRQNREARDIMESSMKLTNLIAMPAAVGLAVMSKPIFEVLFPNTNENGPKLMVILGIASFFVCTYIITNAILQASGNERLALLTLPAGGLLKIGVNWFVVGNPDINIMGAPIGTLACYVFITVLNMIFIAIKVEDRPRYIKTTVRPLLCTLIMGGSAWALYGLGDRFLSGILGGGRLATAVIMVATIAVAMVIYGVLVIALGAITKEDMKLIPKGEKFARILRLK